MSNEQERSVVPASRPIWRCTVPGRYAGAGVPGRDDPGARQGYYITGPDVFAAARAVRVLLGLPASEPIDVQRWEDAQGLALSHREPAVRDTGADANAATDPVRAERARIVAALRERADVLAREADYGVGSDGRRLRWQTAPRAGRRAAAVCRGDGTRGRGRE